MSATVNSKAYVGTGWKPASSTVYFKDWYEYPTTVGVENLISISSTYAYPNPAQGTFSIISKEDGSYELYSIAGQKVLSGAYNKSKLIEASSLASGLYILKIYTGQATITQKMQIEN